ncbi:hypothetical protein [Sporosarcina sp. P12(2017)]|nr:hypothetical protein [Sporosarcina sp. P12(2017)]
MDKSKQNLIEVIQSQEDLIIKQTETIFSLVNETVEQESIIGELMKSYE